MVISMHKDIKKMFEKSSRFSNLILASIVLFLIMFFIFNSFSTIINSHNHSMIFNFLLTMIFSTISASLFFIIYMITTKEVIAPTQLKIIEILDLLEDEITIVDAKALTFTYLNQSLLRNTYYNKNELIGKSINNLYINESSEQVKNQIMPLINKEINTDTITFETIRIRKDGSTYPVLTKLKYFDDTNSIISISHDLTKKKEVENVKTQFVSMISHELRTPLTNITGALKIILNGLVGQIPATMEEMLNLANNNAVRLLDSINKLVDVEKIKI